MKNFLRFLGVLLLAVIATGLVIPNHIDVRRSVLMDATPEKIHPFVNDLTQWPSWSPWIEGDPSVKTHLGDISQGTGASQSWTSNSGNGQLTFTESNVETGIVYTMKFEGDSTDYLAGLSYEKQGTKTLVTWYMQGDMQPIIIGNYFALLMDSLVGGSFELGLEKLKVQVEKSE